METPENLKYRDTDEWVNVEGTTATVGISDYAQDQLSDIVFVEYNFSAGDEIKKDDVLATIESVKAAGDVLSPVSGKILEVNQNLEDKPETLNEDPFKAGWMCKIEMSKPEELDVMMNASDYIKYCNERD
jgi:glycine cleavage system H protein